MFVLHLQLSGGRFIWLVNDAIASRSLLEVTAKRLEDFDYHMHDGEGPYRRKQEDHMISVYGIAKVRTGKTSATVTTSVVNVSLPHAVEMDAASTTVANRVKRVAPTPALELLCSVRG